MPRAHFTKAVVRRVSGAPADGTVAVYEPGSSTLLAQPMYATDTTTTTLPNPFSFTGGVVDFYVEDAQRVRLVITPQGATAQTFDDVDVLAPPDALFDEATDKPGTDAPSTYRYGTTMHAVTASATGYPIVTTSGGVPSPSGTVVTHRVSSTRVVQYYSATSGVNRTFWRSATNTDTWSDWQEMSFGSAERWTSLLAPRNVVPMCKSVRTATSTTPFNMLVAPANNMRVLQGLTFSNASSTLDVTLTPRIIAADGTTVLATLGEITMGVFESVVLDLKLPLAAGEALQVSRVGGASILSWSTYSDELAAQLGTDAVRGHAIANPGAAAQTVLTGPALVTGMYALTTGVSDTYARVYVGGSVVAYLPVTAGSATIFEQPIQLTAGQTLGVDVVAGQPAAVNLTVVGTALPSAMDL